MNGRTNPATMNVSCDGGHIMSDSRASQTWSTTESILNDSKCISNAQASFTELFLIGDSDSHRR
jgi:hypothetical protein